MDHWVGHFDGQHPQKFGPATEGRALTSSGHALPDTLIDIRAPDGQTLPERRVGEIFVRSPSLFTGYFANQAETEKVLRDGVYATGDLGFMADGELYVIGRARDTIVVGGQNIYPQDIEAALAEIPGLAPGRSVAFGIADAALGTERLIIMAERDGREPPVAGLDASDENRPDDETIRAAIFASVAATTRVTASDIRLVPPRTLVKSSAGKLSRAANRERYLAEYAVEPQTQGVASPTHDGDSLVDRITAVVRRQLARNPAVGAARAAEVGENTPLISSGLIDSFALVELVVALEEAIDRTLPLRLMAHPDTMDSIGAMARALADSPEDDSVPHWPASLPRVPQQIDDIALRHAAAGSPRFRMGFWSLYTRLVFRRHGIHYHSGLRVLGPLLLRLDGDPRNIRLGRNVTLMPWVDLKVREQGRIDLGDDVVLDTCARLVAAREGAVILGDRVQIAMSTIINAGDLVVFGRDSGIAAHGNVIASEHRIDGQGAFMESGYLRKPVLIGEGVWIAAGCMLRPGARIGDRAVIGAHAVVEGDIPAGAIDMGQPARPVRFRT